MSNRLDNTRVVKFKADYPKKGKVIYAKGSEHPIHFKTVETLKKNGAEMDVKEFDQKKAIAEAKKTFEDNAKKE